MSDLKRGLLKCFVSKGMFGDEYAVEFSTVLDQKVSLFASKSSVKDVDEARHTGFLKVKFYGSQNSDSIYVLLPSETLEQGSNIVQVAPGELTPA